MKKSNDERRKYERYDTEAEIYFHVTYEVKTKVEFQILESKSSDTILSRKYIAISRNVSAEAICFCSEKQLKTGDMLFMEVYLPSEKKPIHMEGQVRWSCATKQKDRFDTGVKLNTVNGKPVHGSIYFDEENKVVWSAVLDSVFGNFRKLIQNQKKQK